MKRFLKITVILFLGYSVSNAQNESIENAKLVRIFDEDTTFFFRLFEIDINKKNVYAVNPVMNYLDIVGGKPKYEIKLKRKKRNKIMKLLSEIDLSNFEESEFDKKNYSIFLFFDDNFNRLPGINDKTFTTQKESELEKLREIIRIIRR